MHLPITRFEQAAEQTTTTTTAAAATVATRYAGRLAHTKQRRRRPSRQQARGLFIQDRLVEERALLETMGEDRPYM